MHQPVKLFVKLCVTGKIKQKSHDTNKDSAMTSDSYDDHELDELYSEAVKLVTESRIASVSAVQRHFKIGYNRSSTIIETMETDGIVSSAGSSGKRIVLAPPPVVP
jgi:DNA segregation ATPase FtsK/SpoIIIE-like protein